jgi:phage shock protein PspC (stress-responsive transcriptional regulator)
MNRRLYRSNQHKIIGGVCGGLGEHFDVDPTWFRLAFVVLTIFHGAGIVLYVIGWIIIPRAQEGETPPVRTETRPHPVRSSRSSSSIGPLLPGIILIGLGLIFLLRESFWWFDFHFVWPAVLIIVGGVLLYRAIESKSEPAEAPEQEVTNES